MGAFSGITNVSHMRRRSNLGDPISGSSCLDMSWERVSKSLRMCSILAKTSMESIMAVIRDKGVKNR